MSSAFLLWAAALLLVSGGMLLLLGSGGGRNALRAAIMARIEAAFSKERRSGTLLERLEAYGAERVLLSREQRQELERLLRQAGLSGRAVYFYLALVLLAALGALAGFVVGAINGYPLTRHISLVLFGLLAGYLLPKRMLAFVANRRRRRIAAEVPVIAHVLRMLMDAGVSYEAALRIVRTEARDLAPEISRELDRVIDRVDAGLELGEALDDMTRDLEVAELRDLTAMLRQMITLGGSARESLTRLIRNMEAREETTLKEKVNKISGKMSIIMMVFLFPALLIFLAGPAVIGIGDILGGVGR
mgnify:CR=1 FL=1